MIDDYEKKSQLEDILNLDFFVNEVFEVLKDSPNENGFTISINGQWGAGKSSIKNFLEEKILLDESNSLCYIEYNPWDIIDKEKLLKDYFEEVGKKIDDLLGEKSVFKLFNKYLNLICDTTDILFENKAIKFLTFFIRFFATNKPETIYDVKQEIQKKLSKLNKKIIVMIDDLDRLLPDELCLVLKLIKEIANFPNIIYVLFIDKQWVCKGINHHYDYQDEISFGNNYLDKFIQYSFNVPELRFDDKYKYFLGIIPEKANKLIESDEKKHFEVFFKNYYAPIVSTLRHSKLVLNQYNTFYNNFGDYVNVVDLIYIITLRVLYFDLFIFIKENSKLFIDVLSLNEINEILGKEKDYSLGQKFLSSETALNDEEKKEKEDLLNFIKEKLQLSLKYEKVHSVLFNSLIYFFPNFARNIGKEFKPIDNAIARQCVSTGTYFYTYFFQDKELRYKSSNQIKELIKRNNNHEIAEYIFSMSEKKENLQFVLICLYENWKIDKTNNDGNTIDLLQEIFYFGNESKDNTWLYIINEKFLNDEKTTQESLTFRNILDNLGNKETFSSYYKSIILFLKSNLYNDKKPDYLGDMEKELFDYLITQKESCLDFDIKLFSNLLEILWFEKQNDNTNTLLSWSDKYIIYFILSFMWIINKPYPNFYEKNEKRSTECLLNKMNFKVPILFEKEEFIKNYIDSLEYKKFSDNDRLIFDSYCYSVGIMDYDDKENKYKLVKDYGNKSDN